ncbi:MAG: type III-B CRISPR module RAMP protein Cmr6, partial [Acidobacteria bacterium]
QTANAGLWLNKFLDKKGDKDTTAKPTLVKEVVDKASNQELQSLYGKFFVRWKQALKDYGVKEEHTRKAKVCGRMVVGLGSESVLETSVMLHHTYGVPYIPGSALKGLARHFAGEKRVDGWEAEHTKVVFGNDKKSDDTTAGYITFFDALYVPPQNGTERFLHADVMTVHHGDYYMKENIPPTDWDDPTPIPFLSATGIYLLALAGPEDWINPTFKLLELALKEEGIGAKTSSGYGRMKFI